MPASARMKLAGVSENARASVPSTSSPIQAGGGEADEHQDSQRQLIAAYRLQSRNERNANTAMLPWHQRRSRRMNSSRLADSPPSPGPLRQHAHVVAGGAHQHRLDLIVAEDMAIFRSVPGTEPAGRNVR